jgi:hypothetical protein
VDAEANCRAYNLATGNCDRCSPGFYIDYAGHCEKEAVCGASQWSVNGACIGIPENCVRPNELGLCALCANSNYRLEHGQCVFFKSCLSTQYLSTAGECVDVDASCGLFNPTNGQCVTCKSPGLNPTLGVCCPEGQVYNRIACVDAGELQRANQESAGQSCLLFHPSLGYCLRCSEGYSPDPLTLTGCVPDS